MLNDFKNLPATLKTKLKAELPGAVAHDEMLPEGRKRLSANTDDFHKSSVLLLLYPKDNKIFFPVIEKADIGPHAGQLALPGGKNEHTESLWQTALRETFEEINAAPGKIECLGKLSELTIPVSRFRVHPFVGWTNGKINLTPQRDEVKKIIEVDLFDFINRHEKKLSTFRTSYGMVQAPCFVYQNLKIWGATSMILNEFLCIVNSPEKR